MIDDTTLCQCNLPLVYNDKFGVYLCTVCGELADKDKNIMQIDQKTKNEFIDKIKFLQKELVKISFEEERILKSIEQN